jgi:hypothetical protein
MDGHRSQRGRPPSPPYWEVGGELMASGAPARVLVVDDELSITDVVATAPR